jgi:hypothetical protein
LNYVDPTGLIDWNAVVKAGFGSMIAGIIVGAGVGCVTSIELGCVPGAVAGATSGGLTGLVGGTVTALYLELAFGGQ